MHAVSMERVAKRFGSHRAVDDLTIAVPMGCLYGFIGPNGSGKTTTLRMIMDIVRPDTGRIEVLGEPAGAAARDRVAYLPEERGLYRKMKVRALLRYYGRLKGANPRTLDARINAWLDRMDLRASADKRIEALSKGMSQKVQFIAAVLAEPELLILDEPFSGLDPVNGEVLRDAIVSLKKAGTTIVFSTHDMRTAEAMCDRIFMIFRGRKVLDGSLAEIQAAYGENTLRVRIASGAAAFADLVGVESLREEAGLWTLHFRGDPQDLLRALLARTAVQHFEIGRPSLHEIFLRIALPADVPAPSGPDNPGGGRHLAPVAERSANHA